MRGSMPPKFEVKEVLKTLEKAGVESRMPVWENGRMIMQEDHIALKDDMTCSTRKHLASYGLEEVELRQEGQKLCEAGTRYVPLAEHKVTDSTTPSLLTVGNPGDRRSLPVENRFKDALERDQAESGEGESMDETLSKAGEEMELGTMPEEGAVTGNFSPGTTRELLQDLSGDDWADKATSPVGSPRKNLELPLASEPSNMGMVILSNEMSEKNAFEGNKWMFSSTLDEKTWRDFLNEFNQKVVQQVQLGDFVEELWDTVMGFGEPVLMTTGLDEKARGELLEKMVRLSEQKQSAQDQSCKDSCTRK